MLTPIPKELIQQAWNYDIFLDREIASAGGRTKFMGAYMPSRLVHGLKVMRLFNEMDKMTDTDRTIISKVVGLVTGKMYPYDEEQRKTSEYFDLMDEAKEIKQEAKRAYRKGGKADIAEVERLKRLLKKKVEREKKRQK